MADFLRVCALLAVAATLPALAACQPAQPAAQATKVEPTAGAPAAAAPAKPNGVFTVQGVLSDVRDAGYPMFVVTLTPEGGGEPLSLTWMDGDDSVKRDSPNSEVGAYKGKRVSLTYERAATFSMEDLRLNGVSLLKPNPEYPIPASFGPEVKEVAGVLTAPDQTTAGDLPDELSITGPDGRTITVEHFIIEDEIIASRGKTVRLYYSDQQTEKVTEIKKLP
jgi:hypothetical protein